MRLKRLFPFILVLAVGCRTFSAERGTVGTATSANSVNPLPAANTTQDADERKQIDLNKFVLLTNSDESRRIDAASLLLFNKNPYARQVLTETLNLTNNSPARMAVCNALIQTRKTQQEIPNKNDFIEPLLGIFSTKVDEEARLAADAIMIYKYQEIGPLLDKLVTDPEKPAKTRINVIGALKKIPEMDAIIRLYSLVDDPDQEVASEAGNALSSSGFQVGINNTERERLISNLRNKGIVEVLRERLIIQDSQINKDKVDFETLKKYTLTQLDAAYQGIGVDDASKGKFLPKYLTDSYVWVKLWALEKVRIWRTTPQTSIPAELEPVIISLMSDPSREIRLKTVDLIGLLQPMRTVDLPAKLIAQFEVEQDEQVKNELLDIMGIVCSTSLSTTSSIKITPETRQRVLGYASDYLSKDDPAKAKIGAKVMRQLLEREGMQEQDIKIYLGQLSDRFNRQKQDPNNTLMAELLNAMTGLAADNSASRDYARKAFEPFFTEALNYDNDLIRETAIDGLVYINKANALKILSSRIDKERSEKLRLKIIRLAEDVGGRDDLGWLAKRLGPNTNSEAKQAWAAMLKIFEQQKIDFLKKVLAKTPAGSKQKYQEQIASRSFNTGQYEQAANYYTSMYNTAATAEEKDRILPRLLDSCLRTPNVKDAASLIMEYLSSHDFNPESPVISSIDSYFKDSGVVTDKSAVLKALKGIELSQAKPGWKDKLQKWTELLTKTEPEKPADSATDNG